MNPWLGEIVRGKFPAEAGDNRHRPTREEPFPMAQVIQRRAEMVSQRHALLLLLPQPIGNGAEESIAWQVCWRSWFDASLHCLVRLLRLPRPTPSHVPQA